MGGDGAEDQDPDADDRENSVADETEDEASGVGGGADDARRGVAWYRGAEEEVDGVDVDKSGNVEESEDEGDVACWHEDTDEGECEKTNGYNAGKVDFDIWGQR